MIFGPVTPGVSSAHSPKVYLAIPRIPVKGKALISGCGPDGSARVVDRMAAVRRAQAEKK
jgi:hypothetical protein